MTDNKRAPVAADLDEREPFRRVFLASPVPTAIARVSDGTTVMANPACTEMFGWRDGDVGGRSIEVTGLWTEPEGRALMAERLRGEDRVLTLEETVQTRSGAQANLISLALMVLDGELCFVCHFFDITERKRAEDVLRDTQERFRLLAGSVTDYAIIMLDPEGRVAAWNPGAEAMKGYQAEEIIGRSFSVFYPRELAEAGHPQRELAAALAEGRYQEEGERVRKDGSRFWANVTLTSVHDDAGELRGFAQVTRDNTELRRVGEALRESEQRFRLLAENSTDVITRSTPDAVLLYASPSLRMLCGYEPEERVGRSEWDQIHPEDREALHAEFGTRAARSDDTSTNCYRIRRKNGGYVWVESNSHLLRDPESGEIVEFQSTLRDITERKQAEADIRRVTEAAEHASSAKSEFLSRMSHELRTPLHAILGFGELLGRDHLPSRQHENLAQITKGAGHLLELINEVLDLAAIERGDLRMSPEPVHVGELVHETLALVAPLAASRSLKVVAPLVSDFDVYVTADRQRFKQTLLNLLSNSVKYNREAGDVHVTCTHNASRARIEVADSGVGIATADVMRVFEPFDRLGAEATGVPGTGLGLALTKRLVEAMGGDIGVESELGRGTRFWVELALAAAPRVPSPVPPDEPTVPAIRTGGVERTVLYIEDNPSNIKLVETILVDVPEVTLLVASQGSLGLELAREHQLSLVLLDLNLPDMAGEEVLRRIRRDPRTAELAVVMLSADATPGQAQRLKRLGANDYLTKPVSFERLLAVIDHPEALPDADPSEEARSSREPGMLDPRAIQALRELAAKPNAGSSAIPAMVNGYLSGLRDQVSAIQTAAQHADLSAVRQHAHALSGASGAVGAARLLSSCRVLEAEAKQGDVEGVRGMSLRLDQISAQTRTALEREFDLAES